ncbi:H-NS histone family protein [Caballeronia ptereochthonis]|uniref:Histone family protein nucleoid-structuring protein H-NS n=1 Tax=Caballeronia ptereochthonis TaxID=1777144 RepID=A0A158CZU5_9BURK|nr:H-NS histone family protein [Caballeronia ptereochthonis]SAK87895.1 histone family protein nucleoid-structuring protein H-NS [Caballeronia ptereochthonis]
MATLAQLEIQIQKLQRRADALRERKSVRAIADIRALMEEYGLTTADLVKAGLGKKPGRPVGSKNAPGSSKKTAAKSKLPPKYRDPVSGATWSGHARPPAWIKDVPDRSVYLIGGAGGAKSGKNGAARKGTSRGRGASASASRAAGAKRAARGAVKKTVKRAGRPAASKTVRKSAQRAAAA